MRAVRYNRDDCYYPNAMSSSSSLPTVSNISGDGDERFAKIKTCLRFGLLYGSVCVGGAILGAMLTLFTCASAFRIDDVTRDDVAVVAPPSLRNSVRQLLRDCYDDSIVNDEFYCSLNADTARRCNDEKTANTTFPTFSTISRTNRDDEIERLSFVDDYAYSTFGPTVAAVTDSSDSLSKKRKIYDTRLRLSRIICMSNNLLIVLTANAAELTY